MNNRKRIEAEVRAKYPEAEITHRVACPLTIVISADGKQGKRSCGFPLFFCPSCIKCGDAKKFAGGDYLPAGPAGGAPQAAAMSR